MIISSRTPEGLPFVCPVCGSVTNMEPSSPTGDVPCPRCGHLMWWLRDRLGDVKLDTSLRDIEIDSLELVEFVMAAENDLGIVIGDEEFGQFQTISDVLRYLGKKSGNDSGNEA